MDKNINQLMGNLEMKLLLYVQMKKIRIVKTGDFIPILGITKQRENSLLSNLNRKGIVVRLKRGVYLTSGKVTYSGYLSINELEILYYLMQQYNARYLVSGPTAMYFYKYTGQIPNKTYVYNDKIYGEKEIGGKQFVFMKTAPERLKAAVEIKTPEGRRIPFASKARFLIDCIYDWNRYNSLPKAYYWIKSELGKEPVFVDELIRNAKKYGNQSVMKRLGYLLNSLEIEKNKADKLLLKINTGSSLIPWFPSSDIRGTVDRKWGLIINGILE